MSEQTRPISINYSHDGRPVGKTVTSVENNRIRGQMVVPSPHVIPIIFLPGIMGSNLKAKATVSYRGKTLAVAGAPVWRVDSTTSFGLAWAGRSAAERQLLIDRDNLLVDYRGMVDSLEASDASSRQGAKDLREQDPELADTMIKQLDAWVAMRADRRRRGWGTVSWAFYGPFLVWLESALQNLAISDGKPTSTLSAILRLANHLPNGAQGVSPINENMIKQLLRFQFPVHAFGYNWADSNVKSGQKLSEYINSVIKEYAAKPGISCNQVVLITHSMGGLVARAGTMLSSAKELVLGVVHGVMPTHGAAAMYKRAVAGFGGETYSWNPVSKLIGHVTGKALGASSIETVPILAFNPGPFELAPNHRYNNGQPWIVIREKSGRILKQLPKTSNPYSEIYRRTDVWWRAVDPSRLNPAGVRGAQSTFLGKYLDCITMAENYHRKLADDGFHPLTFGHYSADTYHAAWGQIIYEVVATEKYTSPTYSVGVGAPVMPLSQTIENPRKALHGDVDTWKIEQHDGGDELTLRDGAGTTVKVRILHKADPGDSTVPATASAAGLDRHAQVICRHQPGYEHDASYADDRARNSVIDSLVRMVQHARVAG
ncbi:esterase/lipase family protein [Xanthomonas translucens]|uniref:esterase/lipase family protein n=1 Tax=Xanthomonas campestris pv. translucens TaxID=343 RepID=UPI0009BCEBF0|nr:hypothetical protein [Xanthomonas translucens]QEO26114.1 hypothetical protein F0H32_07870 [Xanthomonas translucens pv. undulosa]